MTDRMPDHESIAVWALTPNGGRLATELRGKMPGTDLYFSHGLATNFKGIHRFHRLREAVRDRFGDYGAHIFIMSTGIVVRMIAPLMVHKTVDPGVLVMDEKGDHVISLLSGHMGGANRITLKVARLTGADPVITTATDINHRLAIDEAAAQKGLFIETPENIRHVSMAVIKGEAISVHDPYGYLGDALRTVTTAPYLEKAGTNAFLFIDHEVRPLPPKTLVLRPPSLVAGMGCNRGTPLRELKDFLTDVMDRFNLSIRSLKGLASVDLKSDETGLNRLGEELGLPLRFYGKSELESVEAILNPSAMVEKHIGIKSVCEAAAILGAGHGKLIVPKQNTKNVTVAIARVLRAPSTS